MPTRRELLIAGAIPALLAPLQGLAGDFWSEPRSLWLYRAATREQRRVTYFADGRILPDGYAAANWLLRDVQAGRAIQMDPVLLDILCGMQGYYRALGYDLPWVTTSGYRTPHTNVATEGAVRDSQHIHGRASDGFVYGVSVDHQFKVGAYLRGGGVGWYPGKHFIHIDAGSVRYWRG